LTTSENSTESTTAAEPERATQPSTTTPAKLSKINGALQRYRVLAWLTGLWLLLLTAEIIAKYGFGVHTPSWIAVVHGWVYFVYLLVTADLAVKVRWPVLRTVGTLIAGTIPLLSFFVEHVNAKKVKADFNL
jgi:integral membrane protein